MLECISVTQYFVNEVAVFLRLVGRRVALAREGRGLSQAELAERAGLDVETVAGLEQGEFGVEVDQLHLVADVLGLNTADLLPDELAMRSPRDGAPEPIRRRTPEDPAGGRSAGS
jgi:transcriptional regulator with XRE-family HTH domain